MNKITKAQYASDIFTTEMEARARSRDMGLGGEIHVSDYNEQAVYMPAASEDAYIAYYEQIAGIPQEEEEDTSMDSREALRAVVAEIMGKQDISKDFEIVNPILKADTDAKVIWGWAYVSMSKGEKAMDHSGEWISPSTLVKATTNFMLKSRTAKVNHDGPKEGDIVGSLPVTKDLADALGIQTDREGWIIGVVASDETLKKVQSGELTSFSIGGRALKRSL